MQTPYYVLHKELLDEGIEKLKAAISKFWPNSLIGYSFKTNSLPWIIQYMKEQGCYAEVVSEDEYELPEYFIHFLLTTFDKISEHLFRKS